MIICKHCNSDKFEVEVINIHKNASLLKTKDGIDVDFGEITSISDRSYSIKSCSKCMHPNNGKIDDLIIEVYECSCTKFFNAEELEENNCCFLCNNPREDLKGLSEVDYIKKIIELEKQISLSKNVKKRNKKEEEFESKRYEITNKDITSEINNNESIENVLSNLDDLTFDDIF